MPNRIDSHEHKDQPLIANDDLRLSMLPPPRAPYLDICPFALSFDGYRGGLMGIDDCFNVAEKVSLEGPALCSMDDLRTAIFIYQRKLKNESHWIADDDETLIVIHDLIEEIRGRLKS